MIVNKFYSISEKGLQIKGKKFKKAGLSMDNCLWVLFKKRQDDIHNAFVDAQYVKNVCGVASKKLGFNDYPSYLKPIMEDFLSNRRKKKDFPIWIMSDD